MIIYVWIFCLIFTGFLLLFGRIRWVETAKKACCPGRKRDGSVGKTAGIGKPAQAAGTTA